MHYLHNRFPEPFPYSSWHVPHGANRQRLQFNQQSHFDPSGHGYKASSGMHKVSGKGVVAMISASADTGAGGAAPTPSVVVSTVSSGMDIDIDPTSN